MPDEGIKKAIARILQTDEKNTFRLLEELGGDCAGSIYFSKKRLESGFPLQQKYRKVNDEEDFRVSGAGAQFKLVACIFDNTLHLPLNGTPSTHIIKPNIDGYENTTYNELFCMKLAHLYGLETPVGNTDAHGKNFSILYKNNKAELAQCYDILSTAILFPYYNKVKMAMKLSSKKYILSKITRENFEKLAEISGFKKDYILKRVDALCKRIISNANMLCDTRNQDETTASPVYAEIIELVQKHVHISL